MSIFKSKKCGGTIEFEQGADQLERERLAEQKRIAAEKAAKKRKKIIAITTSIVVACIAFVIVLTTVIILNGKYNAAVDLYNAGKYDEAITAFQSLNGYKDSTEQIAKCETAIKDSKYNAALDLYNAGKYFEAFLAFNALEGYKDSTTQKKKCSTAYDDQEYNAALDLYNAGKYDEAITKFFVLAGYKDSTTQITKCETAIKDQKYNTAISLIENGKYVEAYEALIDLNYYKDSTAKAKEIYGQYKAEKLKTAKVGDYVVFGSYEQDNNKYYTNGKEDVEWLVLAKEGNKALLISKYALDSEPYSATNIDVTWETCYLREWGQRFLRAAFSFEEQSSIISSTVTADKNPSYSTSPGDDTTDKVFLLSITEANKYFKSDYARKCAPTDYAIAQGAQTSDIYKTGGKDTCWWWLRSPGKYSSTAARISDDGSVDINGPNVHRDYVAVRPALWIDLGSLIF